MSNIAINNDIPRKMTLHGLEYLGRLARTVPKNGLIVEVGLLFGSYTWILAKISDPSFRVSSIETCEPKNWIKAIEAKFPDCKPFSRESIEYFTRDRPNVESILGESPSVMQNWNGEIDLFFDDTTHGDPGLTDSLDFYLPNLKPGGIASSDDFASGWPAIVARVSDLGRRWGTRPPSRRAGTVATGGSPRRGRCRSYWQHLGPFSTGGQP